jgi:hypothetical protein
MTQPQRQIMALFRPGRVAQHGGLNLSEEKVHE